MNAPREEDWIHEHPFQLNTSDGYTIHGIQNEVPFEDRNNEAVILCHGLTGNPYEHIHQSGRRYFNREGYDVLRFGFYGNQPDARKLKHCTLADHAHDLLQVVAFARQKYGKIYVCGHSYGGTAALIANPDVAGISFWDANFLPYALYWKDQAQYVAEMDCYRLKDRALEIMIGQEMVEEAKEYNAERARELIANLKARPQFCVAEHGPYKDHQKDFYKDASDPKDFQTIANSGHVFAEGDTVFELLEKTHQWFAQP